MAFRNNTRGPGRHLRMPTMALLMLIVTACGAPGGPTTAPVTPAVTVSPSSVASPSAASPSADASVTPSASGTAGGAPCLSADILSSIGDFAQRDLETKSSLAEVADAIEALDLGAYEISSGIRDDLVEKLRASDPDLDEIALGANMFGARVLVLVERC